MAALALAPLVVYVAVAVRRVAYPFELEWMEGGSVAHVSRLLHGHPLYGPPSIDFVAYDYPPLYFVASAAVAKVVGTGFTALRVVSFAGSLGCLVVLYLIVTYETADRVAGIVAAGLFAAAFRLTGAWFDIARVDSLFLFLLLAAVLVSRRSSNWLGGAAAGGLLALSALTKQSAIVAGAPLLLYLVVTRWRVGLGALGSFVVLLGGVTVWVDHASGGWYRYYVFEILAQHPLESKAWGGFWRHDLLRWAAPMVAVSAVGLVAGLRSRAARWRAGFYVVVVAGLVAAAWISRLHTGGYDNVLMPAYAALAATAAVSGALLVRSAGRWAGTVALGAAVLLAVQLALLSYSPRDQVPTAASRRASRALVAQLRRIAGPLVVLDHPWYGAMAGHRTYAQGGAAGEILRAHNRRAKRLLLRSFADAVEDGRVRAVVVDQDSESRFFGAAWQRRWLEVPIGDDRLLAVTGTIIRPRTLVLFPATPAAPRR